MDATQERQLNQVVYRQMQGLLAQQFRQGHYVAFSEGKIIADAEEIDDLCAKLESLGKNPQDVLVVQAGVDHPEHGVLF